jgi:precorrin-6Y C5,15-methyltransferase (decarboxylating)
LGLASYRGHVYAIDKNDEAISLIEENRRTFHIGNVTTLCADALVALADLPAMDAAFIGGNGGEMQQIVTALVERNPRVRIVANVIAIESVSSTISAFEENGMTANVVQVSTARAKQAGHFHMLTAQNPIFVIWGCRDE